MIANMGSETLDAAFTRIRDLDVSLQEQLAAFAEAVRRERPEFAAAVDRLVNRLRQYGGGGAAPKNGGPKPPLVLPGETAPTGSPHEPLDPRPGGGALPPRP